MAKTQKRRFKLGLLPQKAQSTPKLWAKYKKPIMIGGGIVATIITAVVVIKKCLKSPGDTIIAAARKYVGIREVGDNGGWDNAAFQDKGIYC